MNIRRFSLAILAFFVFQLDATLAPAQNSGSGRGVGKTTYAALAVSDEESAYGFSNKKPSRKAAEAAAMKQCRKHANDCKIEMWTSNCLAFARAKDGSWGTAWRETRRDARAAAMKGCRKHAKTCRIKVSVCN